MIHEPLTREQRDTIRAALDERRRRITMNYGPVCRGCGCPYDEFTDGCQTCSDRRRNRRFRG